MTLVLGGDKDLRYNDEDTALAARCDAPRALHVRRIQSRPVGTLDVAVLAARLAETRSV